MDRRIAIAAVAGGLATAASAQNLGDILGKALVQGATGQGNKGGTEQQTSAPGTRPRFEDNVSASTYLQALRENFNLPGGTIIESPIRGLGLAKLPSNFSPFFLNADGTFFGGRTWNELRNNKRVELSATENAEIVLEVIKRVHWEKLVGPVWGAGSRKRAIVYSAPDCPFCQQMEKELVLNEKKLAYELYYLPTMLNKQSRLAEQVMCSADKVSAWMNVLVKRPLSGRSDCDDVYYLEAFFDVLSIGKQVGNQISNPTPQIILETGERGHWQKMKPYLLSA